MRRLTAVCMALWLIPTAVSAQDSMQYYTFQGRDALVTCGQGQIGSRAVRTVFMQRPREIERDLSPTDDKWVSSGCAGYIAEQNRTISAEESRERLNAILNPPPPESYETIMGRIMSRICAEHPDHRDCVNP